VIYINYLGKARNLTKRLAGAIRRLITGQKPLQMIAYQQEKLDNAICFFAIEHKQLSGKPLTQTYLYKYLAFLDFSMVKETGVPTLGLDYRAMKRGPVPVPLYNERHKKKTGLYEFKKQEENIFIIEPKGPPNLDYFSEMEKEKMAELVCRYARRYSRTDEICEDSHKQISAWARTLKNQIIDYRLMFKDDILSKKAEDLTPAEENYITYLAFKSTSKCR
jgi:hypothetical protein